MVIKFVIKVICMLLFCLSSGFTVIVGRNDSNIKVYYAFTAICIAGVILLW